MTPAKHETNGNGARAMAIWKWVGVTVGGLMLAGAVMWAGRVDSNSRALIVLQEVVASGQTRTNEVLGDIRNSLGKLESRIESLMRVQETLVQINARVDQLRKSVEDFTDSLRDLNPDLKVPKLPR